MIICRYYIIKTKPIKASMSSIDPISIESSSTNTSTTTTTDSAVKVLSQQQHEQQVSSEVQHHEENNNTTTTTTPPPPPPSSSSTRTRSTRSSNVSTTTNSSSSSVSVSQLLFLAKDGKYYNTYMEQRDANIKYNEMKLQLIGLNGTFHLHNKKKNNNKNQSTLNNHDHHNTKRQRMFDTSTSTTTTTNRRCSSRIRSQQQQQSSSNSNNNNNSIEGGSIVAMEDNNTTAVSLPYISNKIIKRKSVYWKNNENHHENHNNHNHNSNNNNSNNTNDRKITTKRNNIINMKLQKHEILLLKEYENQNTTNNKWIHDMEIYLKKVENLTYQNYHNVIRQILKLISGDGITYHHWGYNHNTKNNNQDDNNKIYFYKNRPVSLADDMEELYNDACEFESIHGKDLGNGWLLRHPIKKLANYQQYYLSQKL